MNANNIKPNGSNPAAKKITPNSNIDWSKINIAVCVVSDTRVHTGFAMSLCSMMYVLGTSQVKVSLVNAQSSVGPCKSRFEAVEQAQKLGSTHVLFIDTDQVFPANIAHRLVNHAKAIVGCVIPQRQPPYDLNARINGKRIVVGESERGLLPVQTLGTGIMLIDMGVFDKVPKPYFMPKFDANNEFPWESEDESFCYQAGLLGFGIYADVDMSREVGHLGEASYSLAHAYAFVTQREKSEPILATA